MDPTKRVVSGLRPKSKKTDSTAPKPTPSVGKSLRATSVNPLDRLCDLLLPWNMLDQYAQEKKRSKGVCNTPKDHLIPDSFKTAEDYVSVWEPLVVDEIKANILSNLSANLRGAQRHGYVSVISTGVLDLRLSFTKLQCTSCPLPDEEILRNSEIESRLLNSSSEMNSIKTERNAALCRLVFCRLCC